MSHTRGFITFDCYGTLVDWDAGIGGALVAAAHAAGRDIDRAQVLDAYHEIEPVVEAEAYRSYRSVLQETARRVAERLGWRMDAAWAAALPESIGGWPVFPDTVPALERLSGAGYRLGILSNVDRDLIARTLPALRVAFELIVTAEDVGSYKPVHGHFLTARARIGEERWLHAAQSWFHDVVPAVRLGIPVVWINRKRERPGEDGPPERELTSLTELADRLCI